MMSNDDLEISKHGGGFENWVGYCGRMFVILMTLMGMILSLMATYTCNFLTITIATTDHDDPDNNNINTDILHLGLFRYTASSTNTAQDHWFDFRQSGICETYGTLETSDPNEASLTNETTDLIESFSEASLVSVAQRCSIAAPVLAMTTCALCLLEMMFCTRHHKWSFLYSSLFCFASVVTQFMTLLFLIEDDISLCVSYDDENNEDVIQYCEFAAGFTFSVASVAAYFISFCVLIAFVPRSDALKERNFGNFNRLIRPKTIETTNAEVVVLQEHAEVSGHKKLTISNEDIEHGHMTDEQTYESDSGSSKHAIGKENGKNSRSDCGSSNNEVNSVSDDDDSKKSAIDENKSESSVAVIVATSTSTNINAEKSNPSTAEEEDTKQQVSASSTDGSMSATTSTLIMQEEPIRADPTTMRAHNDVIEKHTNGLTNNGDRKSDSIEQNADANDEDSTDLFRKIEDNGDDRIVLVMEDEEEDTKKISDDENKLEPSVEVIVADSATNNMNEENSTPSATVEEVIVIVQQSPTEVPQQEPITGSPPTTDAHDGAIEKNAEDLTDNENSKNDATEQNEETDANANEEDSADLLPKINDDDDRMLLVTEDAEEDSNKGDKAENKLEPSMEITVADSALNDLDEEALTPSTTDEEELKQQLPTEIPPQGPIAEDSTTMDGHDGAIEKNTERLVDNEDSKNDAIKQKSEATINADGEDSAVLFRNIDDDGDGEIGIIIEDEEDDSNKGAKDENTLEPLVEVVADSVLNNVNEETTPPSANDELELKQQNTLDYTEGMSNIDYTEGMSNISTTCSTLMARVDPINGDSGTAYVHDEAIEKNEEALTDNEDRKNDAIEENAEPTINADDEDSAVVFRKDNFSGNVSEDDRIMLVVEDEEEVFHKETKEENNLEVSAVVLEADSVSNNSEEEKFTPSATNEEEVKQEFSPSSTECMSNVFTTSSTLMGEEDVGLNEPINGNSSATDVQDEAIEKNAEALTDNEDRKNDAIEENAEPTINADDEDSAVVFRKDNFSGNVSEDDRIMLVVEDEEEVFHKETKEENNLEVSAVVLEADSVSNNSEEEKFTPSATNEEEVKQEFSPSSTECMSNVFTTSSTLMGEEDVGLNEPINGNSSATDVQDEAIEKNEEALTDNEDRKNDAIEENAEPTINADDEDSAVVFRKDNFSGNVSEDDRIMLVVEDEEEVFHKETKEEDNLELSAVVLEADSDSNNLEEKKFTPSATNEEEVKQEFSPSSTECMSNVFTTSSTLMGEEDVGLNEPINGNSSATDVQDEEIEKNAEDLIDNEDRKNDAIEKHSEATINADDEDSAVVFRKIDFSGDVSGDDRITLVVDNEGNVSHKGMKEENNLEPAAVVIVTDSIPDNIGEQKLPASATYEEEIKQEFSP